MVLFMLDRHRTSICFLGTICNKRFHKAFLNSYRGQIINFIKHVVSVKNLYNCKRSKVKLLRSFVSVSLTRRFICFMYRNVFHAPVSHIIFFLATKFGIILDRFLYLVHSSDFLISSSLFWFILVGTNYIFLYFFATIVATATFTAYNMRFRIQPGVTVVYTVDMTRVNCFSVFFLFVPLLVSLLLACFLTYIHLLLDSPYVLVSLYPV